MTTKEFGSSTSERRELDIVALALRLIGGGFLMPHGLAKLFGWFHGPGLTGFGAELQHFGLPAQAPIPLVLALTQTILGLALVLGVFTRTSALLAAGYLLVTVPLNLQGGWFWNLGGVEYPVFWTLILLLIAYIGSGRYSWDGRRRAHLQNK